MGMEKVVASAYKQQTVVADLLLLITALVWGFGFVAQRAGMEHVGPFTFNGIRFLLGGFSLLPLALGKRNASGPGRTASVSPLVAGGIAGLVLFCGASLQQIGLLYTTAGKAGFITGLYVIFVPLLGLFFGQRTGAGTWVGALMATAGMYLLSVRGGLVIDRGDLLVLIGALFWAVHVLVLGHFSPRTRTLLLAAIQFLCCGMLSLIVALLVEKISCSSIVAAAIPILYGGLGSVGIGYTLQTVAQKWAHPAHASILLSLEAVFAAIGGWWLLDEVLSPRGLAGCAFMLAGMVFSQIHPFRRQQRGTDQDRKEDKHA
jgi:drug/metabolite transporter (DMT)-like permease